MQNVQTRCPNLAPRFIALLGPLGRLIITAAILHMLQHATRPDMPWSKDGHKFDQVLEPVACPGCPCEIGRTGWCTWRQTAGTQHVQAYTVACSRWASMIHILAERMPRKAMANTLGWKCWAGTAYYEFVLTRAARSMHAGGSRHARILLLTHMQNEPCMPQTQLRIAWCINPKGLSKPNNRYLNLLISCISMNNGTIGRQLIGNRLIVS